MQPASQPAGIGLLPVGPASTLQQKSRPISTQFYKNVIIFVTTTPIEIKKQMSVHGRHASVCKISPSYDMVFRRR